MQTLNEPGMRELEVNNCQVVAQTGNFGRFSFRTQSFILDHCATVIIFKQIAKPLIIINIIRCYFHLASEFLFNFIMFKYIIIHLTSIYSTYLYKFFLYYYLFNKYENVRFNNVLWDNRCLSFDSRVHNIFNILESHRWINKKPNHKQKQYCPDNYKYKHSAIEILLLSEGEFKETDIPPCLKPQGPRRQVCNELSKQMPIWWTNFKSICMQIMHEGKIMFEDLCGPFLKYYIVLVQIEFDHMK